MSKAKKIVVDCESHPDLVGTNFSSFKKLALLLNPGEEAVIGQSDSIGVFIGYIIVERIADDEYSYSRPMLEY